MRIFGSQLGYTSWEKKGIGFLLGVLLVFPVLAFAEDDCDAINAPAKGWMFSNFLPVEDLEIARKNLTSYCCIERKDLFKPEDYSAGGKCAELSLGAESPYRYDHLVDVGLRRLDAESLYEGMSVDPLGSGWRLFVTGTGMKDPELFTRIYTGYWSQSGPYLFSRYSSRAEVGPLMAFITNKDAFTLYDKYINYCFVAMLMYYNGLGLSDVSIDRGTNYGYYGQCLSMVKMRIRQETSFAVMASQYNASRLLVDSLSAYTSQFVQNRLMALQDKIVTISSLFRILANQAPLSSDCMK